MKSKMLLPKDNQNGDDLLAEAEAEKMALLDRLVEYKTFKTMAQALAAREAENLFVHTREDLNNELINALPLERIVHLKNVDMEALLRAFNRVWQEFEIRIMTREIEHMSQTYYSVKNKMQIIVETLLHSQTAVTFTSLFTDATQRTEIIATFIAVLELVRQQFVLIMQNDVFDEIEIIARKNIAEKEIEYGEEDASPGEVTHEHSTGA
jgi:segregation and condensation protein A